MNETNELKNRYLHISFGQENQAIDKKNQAINIKNVAIEERIAELKFNIQTKKSIMALYEIAKKDKIFGRTDVSEICGISYSAAGSLIAKMKENKLITEVKGCGKGKYRFS